MSAVYVQGMAPLSRIQATAVEVSRPPENAMPTFSPTGSWVRTLDTRHKPTGGASAGGGRAACPPASVAPNHAGGGADDRSASRRRHVRRRHHLDLVAARRRLRRAVGAGA